MRIIPLPYLLFFALVGCDSRSEVTFGAKPEKTVNQPVHAPTSQSQQPEKEVCSKFLIGPPRGISCLHCQEPSAEDQANQIVELLHDSCLKNIALNYLVDGTFSNNLEVVRGHVKQLTANGRRLFLILYFLNGASQRVKETPIRTLSTSLHPEEFRRGIVHNPSLRNRFSNEVRKLVPLMEFAVERGAQLIIVPMLEDNLSDEAFESTMELIREEIPAELPFTFARNACPKCYSGNEDEVPPGVIKEVHTASPSFSVRDGIVSNDGSDVNSKSLTLSDLATVRDRAAQLNNIFIFWNAEQQGLTSNPGSRMVHPADRVYRSFSPADARDVTLFLQAGLE